MVRYNVNLVWSNCRDSLAFQIVQGRKKSLVNKDRHGSNRIRQPSLGDQMRPSREGHVPERTESHRREGPGTSLG